MPAINNQVSSKGPAISRAIPALQMIEAQAAGNPALAPAFGGAFDAAHRGYGQTDNPGTMYNPYKMRAYQAGAQNVGTGAFVKILYDTVTGDGFDTNNNFSVANSNYTVPLDGYYYIAAGVGIQMPAVANFNQSWMALIYKNGNQNEIGERAYIANGAVGTGPGVQAMVSDLPKLVKGDVIDIRVFLDTAGGNATVLTGSNYTYWSIHLVSI